MKEPLVAATLLKHVKGAVMQNPFLTTKGELGIKAANLQLRYKRISCCFQLFIRKLDN